MGLFTSPFPALPLPDSIASDELFCPVLPACGCIMGEEAMVADQQLLRQYAADGGCDWNCRAENSQF